MHHSYFVVAQFYGRTICADGVDPELTRASIVDNIRTKQYDQIAFIHHIHDGQADDLTNDLLKEAGFYDEPIAPLSPSDRLADRHDHERKLRVEMGR